MDEDAALGRRRVKDVRKIEEGDVAHHQRFCSWRDIRVSSKFSPSVILILERQGVPI